jgi:hypothetical protein
MMGEWDFSDFPDFANLENDIPWESFGDSTDWSQIFGPGFDYGDGEPGGSSEGMPTGPFGDGEPGGSTGGFPRIPNIPGLGGSGGGAGDSSGLMSLLRGLGLTGGNGGGGLADLLPLLGIGLGGYLGNRATNQATDQMVNAANTANTEVRNILGGASNGYKPYQDAGLGALAKMQAQAPSNLAGNFQGLAGGFKPLGGGRALSSLVRR